MDRLQGSPFAGRSAVYARRGMVATSHPLASEAGIHTLRQGGSAVDAALAANAVLAVAEPTGCGLGGDLFAIVWDPSARLLAGLNASGRSPRALAAEEFARRGLERIPAYGPLSVSVPGCVDGWSRLHERFGQLPFARVLAPAVHHAREGVPVAPTIAAHWAAGARRLAEQPGFAATFLPAGRAPRAGEVFVNETLALTLETIASDGARAFYDGPLAARIDAFCRAHGSFLRGEDLAEHESEWVEPVGVPFRGVEVFELPPNTQGLAVLQILRLLEPFDLEGMGLGSADALHHLVEAIKIAYEDRARRYADPDFADVPVAALLSDAWAEERRRLLDPLRAAMSVRPGDPRLVGGDTVTLAAADADGMMVSLIQSNFRGFGSGLCPDGLGFGLQDRGELFALDPAHANAYAPGKRPFQTIIPGFALRDGEPWLAFGVMGGDLQPQGHVQVLLNHLCWGLDLQAAGDAPRAFHASASTPTGGVMADGGTLALESGIGAEVRADLEQRGHRLVTRRGVFGGYQAVARGDAPRTWIGASDSRKDGLALGF